MAKGNTPVTHARAAGEGCPEAIAALDLSKAALLEASAGTGKTYAIEHLVLRLLIETDGLELKDILVLTFTEKATGELRDKIRARIAWRIARGGLPAAALARLKLAHLDFDKASIFTIHGFCQRILRRYAFENNVLFSRELEKDQAGLLRRALSEEMRSTWLDRAGEGPEGREAFRAMAKALGLGGFKWDKKLFDVAKEFNPARGDRLLPDFDPDRAQALEHGLIEAFAAIARRHLPEARSAEAFLDRYQSIKFRSQTTKKKGRSILAIAFEIAAASEGSVPKGAAAARSAADARAALDFFARVEDIGLTGVLKEGFSFLMPKPDEMPGPWTELQELLAALDAIRAVHARLAKERAALDFADQRNAILGLRARAQADLRARGVITFDSMVEDMCLALRAGEDRRRLLRREFRYCLVDEFQDTDPLQWEIFRSVFLDAGSANPLYLIGDPKQAIYRFRGGDVHTYMEARSALFDLSRAGKAQGLGLDTNYRSSAGMIRACNTIFSHSGWFHALAVDPGDAAWRLAAVPDPLGYLPVKAGGLPVQHAEDRTDRPGPVVLRDFSEPAEGETAESGAAPAGPSRAKPAAGPKPFLVKRVGQWIASEILAIMSAPERLRIPDKVTGMLRPVGWGDVCVLVRTNPEKKKLERMLLRAGIPVQVARRVGLYQGEAAAHVLAMLESLADPRDSGKHARALLTAFFRAEGDPPPARAPEAPHPAFEKWVRLAERRRWQRLFHGLWYDTGLLYRESLREDGDRRIMDFTHIGQNLVQDALDGNLDLDGLVRRLRDLRSAPGADEDAAMHREESEGGKVMLMTMHVSKGLEFPVVFLANFGGNPPAGHFKYRDGGRTVFNLDLKDAEARALYEAEAEGEDRRLYYVALTRARYKLYVPLLPKGSARASTGPLSGFVAEALRHAAAAAPELVHWVRDEELRPAAVKNAKAPGFGAAAMETTPAPYAARALDPTGSASRETADPARAPDPSVPTRPDRASNPTVGTSPAAGGNDLWSDYPFADRIQAPGDFSRRRRRLASFSHLVRRGFGLSAEAVEGRVDKEESPVTSELPGTEAEAPAPAEIPGNALPRGKEAGNMFHEILEGVDFARVADASGPEALLAHAPTRDLIAGAMEDHRVEERWREGVAALIWNTLRAPIADPAGGPGFRLVDVAERKSEMEFLFPYPSRSEYGRKDPGPDGYLWGFIDLVFRHRGRYYLLDWKSNHLPAYGQAELARSIGEARYDLQYMLYALALDRWLESLSPQYDFERDFGGIHYVYLRGMGAAPGSGVFSLRPGLAQMRSEFPRRLAEAMGGRVEAHALLARNAGVT